MLSKIKAATFPSKRGLLSVTSLLFLSLPVFLQAQERPYFVTYTHDLEEPGSLEIAAKNIAGSPSEAGTFLSVTSEFEYGVTAWWTSEVYVGGQTTRHDSTVYTGWRFENRFRPLMREHWINPVLYVEYEDINGADKSLLEVVGHDGVEDFQAPNYESRLETEHELELKLILSKNWRGWNFAQNTIFEKNLSNEPWEFGYAMGMSRPLTLAAGSRDCALCAERFTAGVEMYGGLGDRYTSGLHDTSQYLSPVINWTAPNGTTISFGPAFGLNNYSSGALSRFGISHEIPQFLSHFRSGNAHGGGA